MNCKYFGICASCKLYNMSYNEQLNTKIKKINDDFAQFTNANIDAFESSPERFRNRAEFSVFHHDDDTFSYAMRGFEKERVIIDSCMIVDDLIASAMISLKKHVEQYQILKKKLFGVEFLSNGKDETLAVLMYHKTLNSDWEQIASKIGVEIGIKIIGRSRGQRVVLDSDFVTVSSTIYDSSYTMRQVEGAFSQPNGNVNVKMLKWAKDKLNGIGGDLLELYCGSGNFTIANANLFNKVLATEISSTLIEIAKANAKINKIENIFFARLSAEDTAQALDKVREFNRLKHIELSSFVFSTIFVDPPRAGLDDTTRKLSQKFDNILYISCSPETLHRDLKELTTTHFVESFAVFDQFAYTNHLECGALLRRR